MLLGPEIHDSRGAAAPEWGRSAVSTAST